MGKMKEKFMEEQERLIREAVEAFVDDDWQYQEYLNSLGKSISQKESQANHDAWWSSLTDEQKQEIEDYINELDVLIEDIEEAHNGYEIEISVIIRQQKY